GSLPAGGAGAGSDHSSSRAHTRSPAAFRDVLGSAGGKAASTAGPHSQPALSITSAIARASGSTSSASFSSNARATVARVTQASAELLGGGRPSASARPRGVGTQNRAGYTNAKSSRTSRAGNPDTSSRRAVAGPWHS